MAKIYRKIYRDDVKSIGADAAYFLAELRAREEFCIDRGQVTEDGFFELSVPMLEDFTGFDRFKQERIIAKLSDAGIIEKRVEKCTRFFKFQPVQNTRVEPVQNAPLTRAKCTGNPCKMHPLPVQNTRVPIYISDNKVINSVSNSVIHARAQESPAQQQTLDDLIRGFFKDKNQASEADKFIKYNREQFGPDHLTRENYQKLANKWLKAKKTQPPKRKAAGRAKTAKECAEERGITVEEFLGAGGTMHIDNAEEKPNGEIIFAAHPVHDGAFDAIFGGVQDA